jgi:hypothetical protein
MRQARLQESGMENQTLQSKLQLESSQVRELEGLVARMRAAEHQVAPFLFLFRPVHAVG